MPEQYLSIDEAPDQADRRGRTLDRLVCSLYESRGFELDGIEIKVSMSDWQRELANLDKADWWYRHVHRFWVAVPDEMTLKVRTEMPTGWGLITCNDAGCSVVIKATKHDAVPLPWTSVLGLLRASGGCGANALMQKFYEGRRVGAEEEVKRLQRTNGDERLRDELAALKEKVALFEKSSGLSITNNWDIEDTGKAVALVNKVKVCGRQIEALKHSAERIGVVSRELTTMAQEIRGFMDGGE